MQSSVPPLRYFGEETSQFLTWLRELRQSGLPVYFTLDAGPNVHIICEPSSAPALRAALQKLAKYEWLEDRVGSGPELGASSALLSSAELKTRLDKRLSELCAELYPDQSLRLHQACAYALAGQGKRVRPILTLLCAQALGVELRPSHFDAALAVEIAHTYSLVHDDLPLCDNDALRRGRPTVHVAFDETTALLTGDALLADAFKVLARALPSSQAVAELAQALGGQGMVLGQMLDMELNAQPGSPESLSQLHSLKTGALLSVACALGGLCAGASEKDLERLRLFGLKIGLAFQIQDDLLDAQAGTGKSVGKDAAQGKPTYLSLLGPAAAKDLANEYTASALALAPHSELLQSYVKDLMERRS